MSFYVTTPIYYVNAAPHLGHAYSTIGADILARHKRQRGEDVFFLTGTDEHGEPVAQAAEREGVSPRELADRNSERFRAMAARVNATNDFFIRTSDPRHAEAVQRVLQSVYDRGYVYEGTYEGWYCPRCADFKTDAEIGPENTCPIHRIPLDWESEENWFFRLSTFEQPLKDLYAERPDFVSPRSRYNEALAFIEGGLQDALDRGDVLGVRRSDEEVVGGADTRGHVAEALRVLVGQLAGRRAEPLGGLGDGLAVLVGARQEEHVLAALPHVTGEHVGRDGRVRVPEMGLGVDVVDRRGDVVRHRAARLLARPGHAAAASARAIRSGARCRPASAGGPRRPCPTGRAPLSRRPARRRPRASRGRCRRGGGTEPTPCARAVAARLLRSAARCPGSQAGAGRGCSSSEPPACAPRGLPAPGGRPRPTRVRAERAA